MTPIYRNRIHTYIAQNPGQEFIVHLAYKGKISIKARLAYL